MSSEKILKKLLQNSLNDWGEELSEEAKFHLSLRMDGEYDNIYILKTSSKNLGDIYKLGYSDNIEHRVCTHFRSNPLLTFAGAYCVHRGKEFERYIHKTFKSEIFNEWYSEDTITEIIKLLDLVGEKDMMFKECYDSDKRKLIDRLLDGTNYKEDTF